MPPTSKTICLLSNGPERIFVFETKYHEPQETIRYYARPLDPSNTEQLADQLTVYDALAKAATDRQESLEAVAAVFLAGATIALPIESTAQSAVVKEFWKQKNRAQVTALMSLLCS